MRILVTGATGFIGGFLVDDLLAAGHEIFAVARRESNRQPLIDKGVKLIEADLSDEQSLQVLKQYPIEIVYHCAGLVEDKDLSKLYRANVAGTDNICKYALEQRAQRFIYLSSVATVSGNEEVPLTEDLPYNATNLYGLSKLEAESLVLEYRRHGLPVVIMRPSMVYGEGEPHAFDTIMRLLRYRCLPLIDEGRHKMHIAYVRNLSRALALALYDNRFLEGSFFVADNEVLTQRQIFSILSRVVTGKDPVSLPGWLTPALTSLPFLGKKFKSFVKDREYDIGRLKAVGFIHPFTAQEGLRKSAEYWLKNNVARPRS
ncbi:MAG: NAD(P)-dependent oxidoreductase [Candidatus Omnitrophota bacterium]